MAQRDTSVSELGTQLGIKPVTLYRWVCPPGLAHFDHLSWPTPWVSKVLWMTAEPVGMWES